jgi:ubiquinone/menaquinone biosynthesis C-methylase UbiE
MNSLSTREAYDRLAPSYPPRPHNPLMRAEQKAMLGHWPQAAGRRALDLACGTGRYAALLTQSGASEVCAVDFSAAMLRENLTAHRICADMMQLPFADDVFEIVVSGLAIGHAAELRRWVGEAGRVLTAGGVLLYSDFHPEAARAGLTRSFKDALNQSFTVPHCCHALEEQREAIAAADLTLEVIDEVRMGFELQESFPGSEAIYRQWRGLPLVLIVRARK